MTFPLEIKQRKYLTFVAEKLDSISFTLCPTTSVTHVYKACDCPSTKKEFFVHCRTCQNHVAKDLPVLLFLNIFIEDSLELHNDLTCSIKGRLMGIHSNLNSLVLWKNFGSLLYLGLKCDISVLPNSGL